MQIAVEKPNPADVAALLEYHVAEARALTPSEFSFALPGNALLADDITFWTARDSGALLGFAALKNLGDGTGEVKSMRIAPAHIGCSIWKPVSPRLICPHAPFTNTMDFLHVLRLQIMNHQSIIGI